MQLLTRRHWVLDMDGTLTVPVHDFEAIRDELGLPPGLPILEQLERLPAEEAAPLHARLASLEEELAHDSRAQPGVEAFLRAQCAAGARLGVLTRNTLPNARITLAAIGLNDLIEAEDVLGRDEAPPKPDPAGVHALLERWGAAPADAVMVGDYRFDLEAGRAAGAATLYFDQSGAYPFRSLADHCFSDWRALPLKG